MNSFLFWKPENSKELNEVKDKIFDLYINLSKKSSTILKEIDKY